MPIKEFESGKIFFFLAIVLFCSVIFYAVGWQHGVATGIEVNFEGWCRENIGICIDNCQFFHIRECVDSSEQNQWGTEIWQIAPLDLNLFENPEQTCVFYAEHIELQEKYLLAYLEKYSSCGIYKEELKDYLAKDLGFTPE